MHQLTKIHVAGVMYSVFLQKFNISIRTIHEFSIAIIRELVLLANRCTSMHPKVYTVMHNHLFQ